MEINTLYHWICFIFCLGLAAGGVLVIFRRKEYRLYPAFRNLQYYLVLMYTFGFYALWSQILLRNLFFGVMQPDTLAALVRFLILMSVPFLLIGKLMLVLWTVHVVNRPVRSYLIPSLIPLLLLSLLAFSGQGDFWTLHQTYAAFVVVLMTWVGAQLLFSQVDYLPPVARPALVVLIIVVGVLHGFMFLGATKTPVFEVLFIFLYFLTHTSFVVYFMYQASLPVPDITEAGLHSMSDAFAKAHSSFEEFIKVYGITPREVEIIQKIYQGKANKEIAEELFVTLQTIKDHTHRIYQKTDVKSRSQLTLLVRTFQK